MKKIIRFTASWCQPCKMLAKNLESIETDIPIEVVDIDVHSEKAIDSGIRGVPTLVMMDDEKEVKRLVGMVDAKTLKNWIEA